MIHQVHRFQQFAERVDEGVVDEEDTNGGRTSRFAGPNLDEKIRQRDVRSSVLGKNKRRKLYVCFESNRTRNYRKIRYSVTSFIGKAHFTAARPPFYRETRQDFQRLKEDIFFVGVHSRT